MAHSGSLHERSPGVWTLRLRLGRDPLTGLEKRRSVTFRGKRREAKAYLADMVAAELEHADATTGATFGAVAERWYEHVSRDRSPTTLHNYRANLDRHILPALGHIPVAKVGTSDIDALSGAMLRRGLAPATVLGPLRIISAILNQAVKWEWIDRNVATRAAKPRMRAAEIIPPSTDEVRKVLAWIKANPRYGPEVHLAFRILAATGLRRGEVVGLRWCDVDLERNAIHVRGAVVEDGDQLVWRQPKTATSARVLSIDATTAELLRAQRDKAGRRHEDHEDQGYVLSDNLAGDVPWRPHRLTQVWRRATAACGVKARTHDLRHYAATQAIAEGHDVRTVAQRLGHASPVMTLGLYASVLAEKDRAVADKAGAALD